MMRCESTAAARRHRHRQAANYLVRDAPVLACKGRKDVPALRRGIEISLRLEPSKEPFKLIGDSRWFPPPRFFAGQFALTGLELRVVPELLERGHPRCHFAGRRNIHRMGRVRLRDLEHETRVAQGLGQGAAVAWPGRGCRSPWPRSALAPATHARATASGPPDSPGKSRAGPACWPSGACSSDPRDPPAAWPAHRGPTCLDDQQRDVGPSSIQLDGDPGEDRDPLGQLGVDERHVLRLGMRHHDAVQCDGAGNHRAIEPQQTGMVPARVFPRGRSPPRRRQKRVRSLYAKLCKWKTTAIPAVAPA